jgi:hypothetical protein
LPKATGGASNRKALPPKTANAGSYSEDEYANTPPLRDSVLSE